ncbi:anaerobic C4-dicarboxylate transporter family protein [Actinoplanes sp. NPDC049118]|uniref:anaerobic C4-dicarboxylate transporter family protein n=1 Tax=Actinoplanes sp. NPDC049118 TaxID=3155769 RepID=UPI0033ECC5A5
MPNGRRRGPRGIEIEAAHIIERHPRQITLIAPLTAFAFTIGAGTSNILYPLMPVIYDVSYRHGIHPSRPMTVAVVQSGIALAASPVSAGLTATRQGRNSALAFLTGVLLIVVLGLFSGLRPSFSGLRPSFAVSVFIVVALTTSQSVATRTMVPIGLAGVYALPTGGPQIAGANFDLSGTTKLGTKLVDHSYFVPNLVLSVTTVAAGGAIGAIFF